MAHRCFISFKMEDEEWKLRIQGELGLEIVDSSVNEAIDAETEQQIVEVLRKQHIGDTTVTIHLIGPNSAEDRGAHEQRFIKRELQLSLFDSVPSKPTGNRNGILGIVLPAAHEAVFKGTFGCTRCGVTHHSVDISDRTTVQEFSRNYYIEPLPSEQCAWSESDRFCVLAPWDDFYADPQTYIDRAEEKRRAPIAERVTVFP